MPKALRWAIRSRLARRKRPQVSAVWPIFPGSERARRGWTGWPDGKKFALVLTHDVEHQHGLDRSLELMNLELEYGLRSAFNFIPEGNYVLPDSLRLELQGQGFELGVHDLHHDGKLFASRRRFRQHAARINRYLRAWGATGFRAGFMLHELDWYHDLDIAHDSSTFDTDPFEPQPDPTGTIFPFFVRTCPGHRSIRDDPASDTSVGSPGGYVELPYTLPQDSTLFLLLREQTIDVWKRKLDWIAAHGGMVLLDTHPDYMHFSGRAVLPCYPSRLYREFLEYVTERFAGEFWPALPSQVASHFLEVYRNGDLPERPRRVCMATHSFYESDNRVLRYAETLAQRGDHVDVFALRRDPKLPTEETANGVSLFRIQDRFHKDNQAKSNLIKQLLRFTFAASKAIARRHKLVRYDLVHAHNIPDFVVFASWRPKLAGAKVILDVHDIVPEFFASKFDTGSTSLVVRMLKLMEKLSAAFADHVILANHLWLERYVARSARREKCSVFINNVDEELFRPAPSFRSADKPVILFPGGLQWHQGVDIAIKAFARIQSRFPTAEFHIYGDGSARRDLVRLAADLTISDRVRFFPFLPLRDIPAIIATATLGVVPKRADTFGNEAYSTKIMEFMAVGIPVIVAATAVDTYYFNDRIVRFFKPGDDLALAEAMEQLLHDSGLRRTLVENATDFVRQNSWRTRSMEYLKLVDTLLNGEAAARPVAPASPPVEAASASLNAP